MSSSTPTTSRREMLGQLAATAVTLAGAAACASAPAAQPSQATQQPRPTDGAAPAPAAAAPKFDDSWAAKLEGAKHKAVFDAPEIADGTILANVYVYLLSYGNVYGLQDADIQPVLVIRHAAIPMALDDAMWEKYELGRHAKVKDPETGKWARRNPFATEGVGAAKGMKGYSLQGLHERGAMLLGCNLAFMNQVGVIARRTKQERAAVREELRAHLVPGLTLAHSGVFAVMRAQEAGCTYIRST